MCFQLAWFIVRGVVMSCCCLQSVLVMSCWCIRALSFAGCGFVGGACVVVAAFVLHFGVWGTCQVALTCEVSNWPWERLGVD